MKRESICSREQQGISKGYCFKQTPDASCAVGLIREKDVYSGISSADQNSEVGKASEEGDEHKKGGDALCQM